MSTAKTPASAPEPPLGPRRNPMPLSYAHLAQHCAFCDATVKLLNRGVQPDEAGALRIFLLTHAQNEAERQAFYERYVVYLQGLFAHGHRA